MFKLIDGKLYKAVDESELKAKLDNLYNAVKPYQDGIETCEINIKQYQDQKDKYLNDIREIVDNANITADEKAALRMLDAEKANFLGL